MAGVSRVVRRWTGENAKRAVRRALAAGLNKHTERVFKQTRQEVPKDTLDLLNSGQMAEATASDLITSISYGDASVGDTEFYAERQHEDLTLKHPVAGTKAKFVEDPINQLAPQMAATLAREVKRRGLK